MENQSKADFFPIHLNLKGKKCLVIGGGKVAERKVEALLRCSAEINLISPTITDYLQKIVNRGIIQYFNRLYQQKDLDNCFIVISACNDKCINEKIAKACHQKNIPVNVVDDPSNCSFIIPSVLQRGALTIAVSTQGKCPMLSKKIREKIESTLGPEYAEYTELISEARQKIIQKIQCPIEKKRIMENILSKKIVQLICDGKAQQAKEQVEECLLPYME